MSDAVIIYTDGSARGNPGPGGYGAILIYGDHRKELAQGYRRTTNNRMELMAVIAALKTLKRSDLHVTIYSDSQYVVKAVTEGWLEKWIRTQFKGGKKKSRSLARVSQPCQSTSDSIALGERTCRKSIQQSMR